MTNNEMIHTAVVTALIEVVEAMENSDGPVQMMKILTRRVAWHSEKAGILRQIEEDKQNERTTEAEEG
jgi:hypothetical protein